MRGVWQPRAYRRGGEAGDPVAEAQEFIRDLLTRREPPSLDPALHAELEAIVAAAAAGRL